jgi:hypothetical protein
MGNDNERRGGTPGSEYWQNQDAVFKDAATVFKGKTLDFLGLDLGEIQEPLRTEKAEIVVEVEFSDLTFMLDSGNGLHMECEAKLSKDDLLRFCGYHVDLVRTYGIEFHTVIFTKESSKHTSLNHAELKFAPTVVSCDGFDGDSIIAEIESSIAAGLPVNEMELIYLPFFKSKSLTPVGLLRKAMSLAKKLDTRDVPKNKLYALILVVSNKIIDKQEFYAIWEELRMMNLTVLQVAEEKGIEQGIEQGIEKGIEKATEIIRRYLKGEKSEAISLSMNVPIAEVEDVVSKFNS